ncbi:unnamed protein product [Arctogadus glacialis]
MRHDMMSRQPIHLLGGKGHAGAQPSPPGPGPTHHRVGETTGSRFGSRGPTSTAAAGVGESGRRYGVERTECPPAGGPSCRAPPWGERHTLGRGGNTKLDIRHVAATLC